MALASAEASAGDGRCPELRSLALRLMPESRQRRGHEADRRLDQSRLRHHVFEERRRAHGPPGSSSTVWSPESGLGIELRAMVCAMVFLGVDR